MSDTSPSTKAPSLFVTTRWSVVLAAQDKASPDSAAAWETLCRTYWYPLYAYVRHQGHSPHDAQDLTQEFIARFLAKDYLKAADREKGHFRTFLRVALKRFLLNEWDRVKALKRGGGHAIVSFDTEVAEAKYQTEAHGKPSEQVYEREWAMALLQKTMADLRGEYERAGKTNEYERLKNCLTADRGTISYGQIATDLGMSEGAARVAVHRLRKRFREVFREAVADTVSEATEVDDEVRYVVGLLSQG
ncbi:MAG TPA: sigma-70 family RNA polymerase sigma factor [Verrucomicrobiae bacterium]